jgi:cell division protein ZapA
MSQQDQNISVRIMEKNYQVKCPPERSRELQDAALYLDKRMREMRDSGKVVGLDRIAIITALNLTYNLLNLEGKENKSIDIMASRITDMQKRIEDTLTEQEQLELTDK